jgi:DNA-directed RNA polymerase specialized sigma24 family protein
LSGGVEEQAEDLVHDAFVHFSLQKPNLNTIESLDAYLYRVLRNLRISQARRAAAAQNSTVRLSDFDSAQVGLHAASGGDRARAEAELRAICDYACARRVESKTASTLILRFFHGYYPSEIMKVVRAPGQAVDKMLWIARREIRGHIDSVRFENATPSADIIGELRERIFDSCETPCPSRRDWREVYRTSSGGPLDVAPLAHLVSCRKCLATVNQLLALKPLDDRDPPEMLGPADRPRRLRRESGRRTSETIEHQPKELHILVNGFEVFSQEISSPLTHFHLTMNAEERPGFVEVVSEQGVRLLFLPVDSPPDGPVKHTAAAELSCERRLEVSVQFHALRPMLELRYAQSSYGPVSEIPVAPSLEAVPRQHVLWDILRWLRQPALLGGVVLLSGVAALLIRWIQPRPVSAAAILDRAIASEARADEAPGLAQHRVLRFEARSRTTGSGTMTGHVEVWRNPHRHLKRVHLLDEQHRLANVPASAWQTDLSAADFAKTVPRETLTASEDAGSIRLFAAGGQELRLARLDLHAVERVITDASNIYRLIEEEAETVPEVRVPAGVFEAPPSTPRIEEPARRLSAVDLRDTEIEVLRLLNQVSALTGEDVNVAATSAGVSVRAVVETQQRKQELLSALDAVAGPRVRVQILTMDEAVRESAQHPSRVVIRDIEVRSGEIPAGAELRKLLDAERARGFADDILRHSLQARMHARAFQIVSTRDVEDPRVRTMLHEHVSVIGEETATIRRHLEPIFPPPPSVGAGKGADLYSLVIRQDTLLRAMFSISSDAQSHPIDTSELWNTIAAVERAASSQ